MLSTLLATVLAADDNKSGSAWPTLILFLLIPVAMYFLLIRPQKRRQREMANLQQSISVGDEIMTTSGIYGFVSAFEGDIAWLEVDDNVQIRVARAAIQRKVNTAKGESAIPIQSDVENTKGRIEPAAGTEADS